MKSMMKKIIGVVSIFAIVGLVCAGATFANYETSKIITNYETTDPCGLVINDPDSVGGTAVTSSPSALPVLPAVTDSYTVDETVTDPASSSSEPCGGTGLTTLSDIIIGEITDPASSSSEPGYINGDLTTLSEITDPASSSSEPCGGAGLTTLSDIIIGEITDPASSSSEPVTDPNTIIVHDVEASWK